MNEPPVGKNWRGGVRKCACLAQDCSPLLALLLFLSLHLCHVMPYNAIDYSSTTWTITFGGCRTDVFDLMFCWCHSCTVVSSSSLSSVFVKAHKHWDDDDNDDDDDWLMNWDNNACKVWLIRQDNQSMTDRYIPAFWIHCQVIVVFPQRLIYRSRYHWHRWLCKRRCLSFSPCFILTMSVYWSCCVYWTRLSDW